MLIAVPGWPFPVFWTASMASTRTVSIALRSRSSKPSGSVWWGWAGRPVGVSVAASAGASGSVLRVSMWWLLPRGRACLVSAERGRGGGGAPKARAGAGATRPPPPPPAPPRPAPARRLPAVVALAPTRCERSLNVINPSHRGSVPRLIAGPSRAGARPGCGLQWLRSHPRFEGTSWCPAARAPSRTRAPGDDALRALRRLRSSPRPDAPLAGVRLRGADQAADHRAAAGDDGPGHDAGRPRLAHLGTADLDARRRHPRRGRGQRLQLLLRPRHRPVDAPHRAP